MANAKACLHVLSACLALSAAGVSEDDEQCLLQTSSRHFAVRRSARVVAADSALLAVPAALRSNATAPAAKDWFQDVLSRHNATELDAKVNARGVIADSALPAVPAAFPSNSTEPAAKDAAIRQNATAELETSTGRDGNAVAFFFAYVIGTVLIVVFIGVIFWPQGPTVVFRIIVYVLALSTMKLSVKFVFEECGFNFPKFVTAFHLACSAAVGFALLFYRRSTEGRPIAVPTAEELWYAIVPIALGFGLSLGSNNMALVFCTASFAEIVGATTPIFSVAMLVFMRIPLNQMLLAPTCLVVAGCMTCVTGGIDFSAMGFALCISANVGRSVKTTMQQQMLTGATRDKFEPCTLLAWTCAWSCAMMSAWSLSTEGAAPYAHLTQDVHLTKTLAAVGISCVNACILNLFALFVTKDLGAVGVQIVAQAKSVLTVLGSVVMFGDTLTRTECAGFAAVLIGTYGYARMEQAGKAARAATAKSVQ